jgi:hypothetical protein
MHGVYNHAHTSESIYMPGESAVFSTIVCRYDLFVLDSRLIRGYKQSRVQASRNKGDILIKERYIYIYICCVIDL